MIIEDMTDERDIINRKASDLYWKYREQAKEALDGGKLDDLIYGIDFNDKDEMIREVQILSELGRLATVGEAVAKRRLGQEKAL